MGRFVTIDRTGNVVKAQPGNIRPEPIGAEPDTDKVKMRRENAQLTNSLREAQKEIQTFKSMVDTMDEQAKKMLADMDEYKIQLARAQAEIDDLKKDLEKAKAAVQAEKEAAKKFEVDAAKQKADRDEKQDEIAKLKKKIEDKAKEAEEAKKTPSKPKYKATRKKSTSKKTKSSD